MNRFLVLFSILMAINIDSIATSLEDARNQALSFGEQKNSLNFVSDENKKSVPGYQTDNPQEVKYFEGANINNDAQNKVKNSEEGRLFVNDLPKRPKVNVSKNDSFLDQSKVIEGNPDAIIKMMTGNYEQCKQIIEEVPVDVEIKSCDEYEERVANSCLVGQLINIDDNHKYKCNVDRKFRDKSCDKNLNLTCQNHTVCSKSIEAAVVYGKSAIYNYPNLSVDIPWQSGGCSIGQRITNIMVENPNLIDSFILTNIDWDDSVEIKLNGNVVFRDWYGCERGTIYRKRPNVDLKRFLIKGNNILEMRVSISGMGFAAAKYILKQKCCNSWQDNWEEVCRD